MRMLRRRFGKSESGQALLTPPRGGAPTSGGHKPDPVEKSLHFGCGSLVGAAVAIYVLISDWGFGLPGPWWWGVVAVALVAGCLALRYGDAFWDRLAEWFGAFRG